MLQVISKKFFVSDDLYITNREVNVFSNIRTSNTIQCPIATMEPIETHNGVTRYLLKYDNIIEKQKNQHFQIIAIGDNRIVEDLLCCCSFWFKGLFSTKKNIIESLIRKEKDSIYDVHLPCEIVPSIFNRDIEVLEEDIKSFNEFITRLLGLPRDIYLGVIKVIRQFNDALTTINSNLELAYTMFVASIESLAQNFDGYETKWNDCPKKLTYTLDNIFKDMEQNLVDNIRAAIIDEMHVQLFRRYHAFALSHISESFYREEAVDIKNPCKESQLSMAVKNTYDLRSKYVHALNEVPHIIKIGGESEIYIGDDIYFTFSGLIRFTRHIIWEFIKRQKQIEKEQVNYFSQLPNSFEARLAPQYWIHKVDSFNVKTVQAYLEGFLEYYLGFICSDKREFLNLHPICEKIENIIKGLAKDCQKVPFLTIYILYNLVWNEENRCPNFNDFIERHQAVFDIPCIENAIIYLLTGNEFPWPLEQILDVYEQYDKKRYKKSTTKIPSLMEVWFLLEVANLSIKENNIDLYYKMVLKALHERPGDKFLLHVVNSVESNEDLKTINWKENYIDKIN